MLEERENPWCKDGDIGRKLEDALWPRLRHVRKETVLKPQTAFSYTKPQPPQTDREPEKLKASQCDRFSFGQSHSANLAFTNLHMSGRFLCLLFVLLSSQSQTPYVFPRASSASSGRLTLRLTSARRNRSPAVKASVSAVSASRSGAASRTATNAWMNAPPPSWSAEDDLLRGKAGWGGKERGLRWRSGEEVESHGEMWRSGKW